MDTGQIIEIIFVTILMVLWLVLVAITAIFSIKSRRVSAGFRKMIFTLLAIGTIIVFIGDTFHTIGFDISIALNESTGLVNIFGGTFTTRRFGLFLDALAFILFYLIWAIVIVFRYQEGKFKLYDKIVIGLALAAVLTIMLSPFLDFPNIDYVISIYSIHMILFIIFGGLTVGKLIYCSRKAMKTNEIYKSEEKHLFITGWGFVFSFLFFFLTLALLPLNSKFGLFMIPKTAAYMTAFISLVKGLLIPKKELE